MVKVFVEMTVMLPTLVLFVEEVFLMVWEIVKVSPHLALLEDYHMFLHDQ